MARPARLRVAVSEVQPPCKVDAIPADDTAEARISRDGGDPSAGSRSDGATPEEAVMTRIVRCSCGFELRDADEARLIARVQQHAREAHDLDLNEEQVRAMMEIEQQT